MENFKDVLEKEIKKRLEEQRNIGIQIGWEAFAIQAIKNIEEMHSIREVKKYLKEERDKAAKKLNIKMDEFDKK